MKRTSKAFAFVVFISFMAVSIALSSDTPPSFIIIGKHNRSALSLFAGIDANQNKLKSLINDLRNARRENRLKGMIPPTTPGGDQGDYAVMDIYVFIDPRWATSERLKQFIRTRMDNAEDKRFAKQFANHVAAHYFYSVMTGEEEGSLGLDDGMDKSEKYIKIF